MQNMPEWTIAKKNPSKNTRQPGAKLARDWSPLSRILKVPPSQRGSGRLGDQPRLVHPAQLLPAGDGDDEWLEIQAPRGANYHIEEIFLTFHKDNVGDETHEDNHTHSRRAGDT